MMAALAGGLFALGILVLIQGVFPKRTDLKTRLATFNEHDDLVLAAAAQVSLPEQLSITLLETVKGDDMDEIRSHLAVTDTPIGEFALEKTKAAAGAAFLLGVLSVMFDIVNGGLPLLIIGISGAVLGYMLPDMELKKKAEARRVEFSRALTAYVTLLGSSIAGGGGITTAMADAANMGEGWVFTKIRHVLDEANLSGTSPWVALDRLGRDLRVTPLIELAGSLTLAGNSGARITETLHSRAESSREKELADLRSEAEAKSSSLGMPVGMMLLGWAVFMGYPAVLSLMGIS